MCIRDSNCGDYRLMDRAVVSAILSFPERNRFMKGIMAAAGFKATQVEYDRPERAAGHTKFNFWKLWNFALDGITGFSTLPLRVWTYIGGLIALFSFAYAFWIVSKTLIWGVVTPGFATLTSVAVSYTHLDVYKRQMEYGPHIPTLIEIAEAGGLD